MTDYKERLHSPVWLKLVALGLAALLAFTFLAISLPAGVATFVVLTVGGVVWMRSRALVIEVRPDGLCVGSAHLPAAEIMSTLALDRDETHTVLTTGADARAVLLLRSLSAAEAVQVWCAGRPEPYWLVSSRHPQRMVEALDSLIAQRDRRAAR